MKIAMTILNERVAPVFDSARTLRVWSDDGSYEDLLLPLTQDDAVWLHFFSDQDLDVLICGAISRCCLHRLQGVVPQVFPFVCGSLADVLSAHHAQQLHSSTYRMPGCCSRRRAWWQVLNPPTGDRTMPKQDGTGPAGKGARTGKGSSPGAGRGKGSSPGAGRGKGSGCSGGKGPGRSSRGRDTRA